MQQNSRSPQSYPSFYTLSWFNSFNQRKQPVRICTKFLNNYINQSLTNSRSNKLMEMYVYTSNNVYFNEITSNNLNRQLNWNQKFVELLKKSLNSKNKNVIVQFNTETLKLKLSTQFEQNSIRILLLDTDMVNLYQNPFRHAQQLFKNISKKHNQRISELQVTNRHYQIQIEKMQFLSKQILEQHQFQLNQTKDRFINVVNEVKRKLRPHFGIEEKKQEQSNSETQSRTIFQVKSGRNSGANRQSQNFLNLFD